MPVKEMFIIVRCGYEGIEEICWGGIDREEAAFKIQEYKAAVKELKQRMEKDIPISEEETSEEKFDRWDAEYEWLSRERKAGTLGILSNVDSPRELSPERYCIMKFNEGDTRFNCCCTKMDVPLKQPWLMG